MQYLVLLGAANSRKLKRRSGKAANPPHVNKERAFHTQTLVENFCIVFQKYIQISGSCSYKIVLIEKGALFPF